MIQNAHCFQIPKRSYLIFFLLLISLRLSAQQKIDVQKQLDLAAKQYKSILKAHPDTSKTIHSTNMDGTYHDMPSGWWCSGFFGGSLWYLYEYTKDKSLKEAAHLWSMAVKKEQYNTSTHDLGFMLYCPFGNGYRLTGNVEYKKIMLRGAESLATRFDPSIGVIKSWDSFKGYTYPVIIDNMMNLEFLFWAARESGNKKFYNICLSHADSTLKKHFRKDNSSYHVLAYDKAGKVLAKITAQGAADESAWSRGQAWGFYGFVVMYRETKNKKYLQQAVKIADFLLSHPNLPTDKIPYWDHNAPNIPDEERDASAAAITASGLLELSTFVNKEAAKGYFNAAEQMLISLSSDAYRSGLNENNNFLIRHCTGSKPGNSEIDVPLVYADYYYIEGLLRYHKLTNKKSKR